MPPRKHVPSDRSGTGGTDFNLSDGVPHRLLLDLTRSLACVIAISYVCNICVKL
jgi:hypothetical protein